MSIEDIAKYCLVDASVVDAWESEAIDKRFYPSLDNLLDLCFRAGVALEYFVELPESAAQQQLDLPGLSQSVDSDLRETLEELDAELEKLIPSKEEQELLRRFRKSDKENRELILQLIAG